MTEQRDAFTIAVVGGGAACVAFLHHFTDFISPVVAGRIRVKVFEPRPSIGPGLAYQDDVDTLLLNRAIETMSVSANDFSTFSSWVRWKAHHEDELKALMQQDLSATYVSRALFGRYLGDFFRETRASAGRKGLSIEVERTEVRSIRRGSRYALNVGAAIHEADTVILAIGNTGQRDYYGLAGHTRYLPDPYPLSRVLESLRSAKKICILGASLTAVDIAVGLHQTNADVEIHMLSPTGALPYVKGKQAFPHSLRFLTTEMIRALTANDTRKIELRTLGRLIRAEFNAIGADWRDLFRQTGDAAKLLHDEIFEVDRERPWQTILVATNEIVEYAWNALNEGAQARVLERFARQWMAHRAPMPLDNARLLAGMLDSGRLKLLRTPAAFDRTEDSHIAMTLADASSESYDYVVNATGAAKSIESEEDSRLGWQMLQDGLTSADWRGGIRVDFNTGALLDENGDADWQLRALGHVTSGTYFFVSSLEMVAKRARKIAADIASTLVDEGATLDAVQFS